jgi:integrase/recombinase XerD
MKVKGNGQAKALTADELHILFSHGLTTLRNKAIFYICFFTACRLSEALNLEWEDIVGDKILFKKRNTKGKLAAREIDINPQLKEILTEYRQSATLRSQSTPQESPFVFPGLRKGTRFGRCMADRAFREACARVGIEGASTHSLRRTSLTLMSKNNIPLRHIQTISGHTDLATLQLYLSVSDEDKLKAVLAVSF